jgi:SOS response regulatory protein OraA/RecX
VPRITALRAEPRGRVAVELDGNPWRSVPAEAVLRAGLDVGRELDRSRARVLRRELRRLEALVVAGRALHRRELSEARLARRLERAGVAPQARAATLRALGRAGLVDDRRLAFDRAGVLAERGYGDAWIRWDLERQGIAADLALDALEGLEPEASRAQRVVRQGGGGARAIGRLARRGFGEEAVDAAALVAREEWST